LWHPLALAALNQSPDVAAAAPFVRVVAQLFGPALDDSSVGLANVPLDEMYAEPARAFIEARGGAVHIRTPARISLDAAGAPHVHAPLFDVHARYVISSVPWYAFGNLFHGAAPEPLRTTAANAAALGSSPIVTVNMWLDGPIMSHTFVGLVDAPIHWVFDKGAIVGEGSTHLAIVTSGADDFAAAGNDEVTRIVTGQLARTFPLARDRQVTRSVVVREHRATFSLAPGGPARPSVRTAVPGLFLAGDWTDTGLPATIEGAVVSGHQAADAVLAARAGG
jgi:zeta-carotene desaturase